MQLPPSVETVADYAALPAPALREFWAKLYPRTDPPKGRRLIVRELAWATQAKRHGDLDAETRRLLRAAVRGANIEGGAVRAAKKKTTRRPRVSLQAGTTLIRVWGGSTHEVVVVDDGNRFEYRGERYASLTEIASAITGAHWSGPRFFGLNRKGAKA